MRLSVLGRGQRARSNTTAASNACGVIHSHRKLPVFNSQLNSANNAGSSCEPAGNQLYSCSYIPYRVIADFGIQSMTNAVDPIWRLPPSTESGEWRMKFSNVVSESTAHVSCNSAP